MTHHKLIINISLIIYIYIYIFYFKKWAHIDQKILK